MLRRILPYSIMTLAFGHGAVAAPSGVKEVTSVTQSVSNASRPCGDARGSARTSDLVQMGPLSFSKLVKRVIPAVVNIAVTQASPSVSRKIPPQIKGTPLEKRYLEKLKQRQEEVLGAGSGFVVDPSGVIVTNDHVIGDADDVTVSLSSGEELPAKLIGVDPLTDIAVLKVDALKPLPFVVWGDSREVEVGDWILVAGNPFGFGSSVTAGIVSARGRDLGAGSLDDFLQLDAPINPGNSGGPAFNMRGQVVAVNAAMVSPAGGSVGIGFGIPSEIVAPIVDELRRYGHVDHGWLGITLDDDDDGKVRVEDLARNGPAMRCGIHRRDIILAVNNLPVSNARSLLRMVAISKPGTMLSLVLIRGGRKEILSAKIGKRPDRVKD